MLTVSYAQKEQTLAVISSGFSSLPSTCTCSAFAGVCVYVCIFITGTNSGGIYYGLSV